MSPTQPHKLRGAGERQVHDHFLAMQKPKLAGRVSNTNCSRACATSACTPPSASTTPVHKKLRRCSPSRKRTTTSVTTTTTTLLTKRLSHGLSDKACRHNWQNRRESTKNAVHHEASLGDQPSMKTSRVAAFDRHRGIFLVEAHIATILKTRV